MLVGIIVQVQSHRVQSGLRDLYDNDLTGMGKITFVARDSATNYAETLRLLDQTNPQLRDQLHKEIVGYDQEVGSLLQKIDSDPGQRVHTSVVGFETAYRQYQQVRDQVIALSDAGRQADAEAVGDQLRTQAIDVTKSLDGWPRRTSPARVRRTATSSRECV